VTFLTATVLKTEDNRLDFGGDLVQNPGLIFFALIIIIHIMTPYFVI